MRVAILTWSGLALLAASGGYLSFDPAPAELPPLRTRVEADGSTVIQLAYEPWRAACAAAQLPEPPDLDGVDAVPARLALETAREFARTRDPELVGRLGLVYLALEHHEHGAACFAAAAQLGRERARWWYFLGAEEQYLGRGSAAIAALERARSLEPDYAVTHARLGELYLDCGRTGEAAAAFEEVRRIKPEWSLGYCGLAKVALALHDVPRALEAAQTATSKARNDYVAHRLLSQALSAAGREAEARREAQLADALPNYSGWISFDVRLSEAHALARTQRHLENTLETAVTIGKAPVALRAGEELLQRRPRDVSLLGHLAALYANNGDTQHARELIDKALALQPGSLELQLARCEIALGADDYAAARAGVEDVLAQHPRSVRALEILGRVEFFEGRGDDGVATLRAAIALDPDARAPREVLVELLDLSGRKDEAGEELRTVLARDPSAFWAEARLRKLNGGK